MTLPASGSITYNQVNTETGNSATRSFGMNWVRDYATKDSIKDLNSLHNRAWYQRNQDGNCNNGNCTSNCNCGNVNCTDCYIAGAVDCANCDSRSWLQGNCNCACTYNCTTGQVSYNCICLCACAWSDDMLKEVVGDIKDPLSIVRELKGFYYRGNDMARRLGLDPNLDVGVSAQDVERAIPEVLGPTMGDFKTVRYERMVPVLIEAIKELEKKINEK